MLLLLSIIQLGYSGLLPTTSGDTLIFCACDGCNRLRFLIGMLLLVALKLMCNSITHLSGQRANIFNPGTTEVGAPYGVVGNSVSCPDTFG